MTAGESRFMKRSLRRRRRSEGQSLVEFALVFPIFILVLAGIIDFGLGMYSYMTIQNASREGARLAVTNCTKTNCLAAIQTRTVANSNGLLAAGNVSVTCYVGQTTTTEACTASTAGDSVKVGVSYNYQMIWPLTFGTQIPMSSSATFMLE
ncbi:MAG: TadE/TadG family type IV pilus assembly protein [Chloroflexota bacterium]